MMLHREQNVADAMLRIRLLSRINVEANTKVLWLRSQITFMLGIGADTVL
jgi:hypothetical protein